MVQSSPQTPTTQLPIIPTGDSKAFGITVHGWIAITVVYTICLMSVFGMTVSEPLYTIGGMVVAFYFGQKKQQS